MARACIDRRSHVCELLQTCIAYCTCAVSGVVKSQEVLQCQCVLLCYAMLCYYTTVDQIMFDDVTCETIDFAAEILPTVTTSMASAVIAR